MVLSIIFLEDEHKMLLHLSIFYEYQQFFQHRICFPITNEISHVTIHATHSDPWPTLARSTSFFLICSCKQTAFKILIQCCPSSTSIKYWPSWTADCRLMFGCIYFVSVSRCSRKCKNMTTALTQPPIKLWWSRVILVWI